MLLHCARHTSLQRRVLLVLACLVLGLISCDKQSDDPATQPVHVSAERMPEAPPPSPLAQSRATASSPMVAALATRATSRPGQDSPSSRPTLSGHDQPAPSVRPKHELLPDVYGWAISGKKFLVVDVPTPLGKRCSLSDYVLRNGPDIVARCIGLLPPQGVTQSGVPFVELGTPTVSDWEQSSLPVEGLKPSSRRNTMMTMSGQSTPTPDVGWAMLYPGLVVGRELVLKAESNSNNNLLTLAGQDISMLMEGGFVMSFKKPGMSQEMQLGLRREDSLRVVFVVHDSPDSPVAWTSVENAIPVGTRPSNSLEGQRGATSSPAAVSQPAAIQGLDDPNWTVRLQTLSGLVKSDRVPAEYLPQLLKVLKDPMWPVRLNAVVAVARIGAEASQAVPPLMELVMNDKEKKEVRNVAIVALAAAGCKSEQYGSALMSVLKDERQRELWDNALTCRVTLWPEKAEEALAVIQSQTESKTQWTRLRAVQALGALRPPVKVPGSILIRCLSDSDESVRAAAVESIVRTRISDSAAIPILQSLLAQAKTQRHRTVAAALMEVDCASALIQCDGEKSEYLEVLLKVLSKGDSLTRARAAQALGLLTAAQDVASASLVVALTDEESKVRLAAIESLQKIGMKYSDTEPALRKAVDDNDEQVRKAASAALGIK